MKDLVEALKAISSCNKLNILRCLVEGGMTHNELHRALGISSSTLSRSLKSLVNSGVVRKEGRYYYLTGMGHILTEYLCNLEEIAESFDVVNSSRFAVELPVELKPGIIRLKGSEVYEDPYDALLRAFEDFREMRSYGNFIDGVVVDELIRYVWLGCAEGAKVRSLVFERVLDRKVLAGATVLRRMCDRREDIEEILSALRTRLEVRVAEPPVQLAIIDGRVLYMQILPADDSYNSPVYVTRDRKCIKWANCVFEHFWERGDEVDFVSRLENYCVPQLRL